MTGKDGKSKRPASEADHNRNRPDQRKGLAERSVNEPHPEEAGQPPNPAGKPEH
jgi:hypothetical protein